MDGRVDEAASGRDGAGSDAAAGERDVAAAGKWVVVHTTMYPQDIYLAQMLLDAEGVDTLIKDELTAQVNNFFSTAIGGVKLMVRAEEAERAYGLLVEGGYIKEHKTAGKREAQEDMKAGENAKARKAEKVRIEVVRAKDREHCPYCGSAEISKTGEVTPLAMVLGYVFGLVLPLKSQVYKCWDCERKWKFRK